MFTKAIFDDKNKINKLVNLRLSGYSLVSLSYLFGVHYTDLIYQFRKYNIKLENTRNTEGREVYDIPRITSGLIPRLPEDRWFIIDGEKFNRGKSYAEYLADSKRLSHRS